VAPSRPIDCSFGWGLCCSPEYSARYRKILSATLWINGHVRVGKHIKNCGPLSGPRSCLDASIDVNLAADRHGGWSTVRRNSHD
jgi:hypothetical protein